ncbi:MAG TPA: acetyl-CoA carboxylase biotin carboxyl carrier protein [Ruminococcaceae bacterium]|nr:acetyl-CoA carboxylase biotin carboxyl carrier protein [Oscillospiraceae bacterium]
MNKKELLETVEALSQQINNARLDEIEVETDEFRIKLSKRPPMPPAVPMAAPAFLPASGGADAAYDENETNSATAAPSDGTPKGKIIKSPIIGTFYAAAAPGKPAFVSVGSKIKKGSVVCIVESMKLMNEITSEFDGTVAEIYVNDAQSVEYDQPLFRLE